MPARAAGDAIWKLRLDYDPSAGLGVPPHVTLMYPFLPPAHLSSASIEKLERLAAEVAPFDFALTNVREFEQGVVYLEPEPAEAFVKLSAEIGRAFGLVPYGGDFGAVAVPHLTVAMPQVHSITQRITDLLAPSLPIRLHADQAWLMVGDEEYRWARMRRLPFSGVSLRELTDFFKTSRNVIQSPYGFSVEIAARMDYPAVWMRYTEGERTVDVFAEAMARTLDFMLDPSSVDRWSAPHELELIDGAERERILERVEAALEFDGLRIERFP